VKLRVHEIFYSIQGESVLNGFTSLFIRLAGCNLDCSWCDTPEAKDEEAGTVMAVDYIMELVREKQPFHHVTLTGGEPFLQNGYLQLLYKLSEEGIRTQVETNGSFLFKDIPDKVRIITDIKTPSSGEQDSFNEENLKYLRKIDEVKFVIAIMEDFEFAKTFIQEKLADAKCTINLSPVLNMIEPWALTNLIVKEKLPVRLNVQMHKIANFK
jgi:7-carboxy-7-deazaguanine synthase